MANFGEARAQERQLLREIAEVERRGKLPDGRWFSAADGAMHESLRQQLESARQRRENAEGLLRRMDYAGPFEEADDDDEFGGGRKRKKKNSRKLRRKKSKTKKRKTKKRKTKGRKSRR